MNFVTVSPVSVKSEDATYQENVGVCCGCLSKEGKLHNLHQKGLALVFTDLTGCTMPGVELCWMCLLLLRKFHSFRLSCLNASYILRTMHPEVPTADNENGDRKYLKHNFIKTEPKVIDYVPGVTEDDFIDTKEEYYDEIDSYNDDDDDKPLHVIAMEYKTECNNKNNTTTNNETTIVDPNTEITSTKNKETKKRKIDKTHLNKHNKKRKERVENLVKSKDSSKKKAITNDNDNSIDDETDFEPNESNLEENNAEDKNVIQKSDDRVLIVKIASLFRGLWRGRSNTYIYQMLERIHLESIAVKTDEDAKSELTKEELAERRVIRKFLDTNKKLSDIYNVDVEFVSLERQREEMEGKRRGECEEGFCTLCCRKYNSTETYDRHMRRTHNRSFGNECAVCGYRFVLQRELVGHLTGTHARRVRCRLCAAPLVDDKWSNIREHSLSHRGVVTHCEWCGKNFTVKKMYYMHLRSAHGPLLARAECLLCGDAYNGRDGLRQHVNKIHTQAAECESCGVLFRDSDTLRSHAPCDHGASYCPLCAGKFPSAAAMRAHYDELHAIRKCTQRMKELASRCSHINLCYLSLGISTLCAAIKCKKTFVSVTKLRSHKCRVSGKERVRVERKKREESKGEGKPGLPYRFVCEYCGKNFKQKIQLQHHQRTHTGEKPYRCDHCHKHFAQEYFLKVHRRKHTGERFQCDVCKKTYAIENYLKIHMRVHTGARPYQCAYCPNTFRQPSHLRAHMPSHTKERAHVCEVCQKSFTQRCNMLEHVRVIHDGLPPRSRQRRGKQTDF